jgi:hypothetical protein
MERSGKVVVPAEEDNEKGGDASVCVVVTAVSIADDGGERLLPTATAYQTDIKRGAVYANGRWQERQV